RAKCALADPAVEVADPQSYQGIGVHIRLGEHGDAFRGLLHGLNTHARTVAAAGFADAPVATLQARTLTVSAALTHAENVSPAVDASASGMPSRTASPSAEPVTVIVRSEQVFAETAAKSRDAVFVRMAFGVSLFQVLVPSSM